MPGNPVGVALDEQWDYFISEDSNSPPPESSQEEQMVFVRRQLASMSTLLAKSHKTHLNHGKENNELLQQVLGMVQNKSLVDVETLGRTIEDVKESAHWAQQVHELNRELKVQRYSWEQVHNKYMEAESLLQDKEQHLVDLKNESEYVTRQSTTKLSNMQSLLDQVQLELQSAQAELNKKETELRNLKLRLRKAMGKAAAVPTSTPDGGGVPILEAAKANEKPSSHPHSITEGGAIHDEEASEANRTSGDGAVAALNQRYKDDFKALRRKAGLIVRQVKKEKDAEIRKLQNELVSARLLNHGQQQQQQEASCEAQHDSGVHGNSMHGVLDPVVHGSVAALPPRPPRHSDATPFGHYPHLHEHASAPPSFTTSASATPPIVLKRLSLPSSVLPPTPKPESEEGEFEEDHWLDVALANMAVGPASLDSQAYTDQGASSTGGALPIGGELLEERKQERLQEQEQLRERLQSEREQELRQAVEALQVQLSAAECEVALAKGTSDTLRLDLVTAHALCEQLDSGRVVALEQLQALHAEMVRQAELSTESEAAMQQAQSRLEHLEHEARKLQISVSTQDNSIDSSVSTQDNSTSTQDKSIDSSLGNSPDQHRDQAGSTDSSDTADADLAIAQATARVTLLEGENAELEHSLAKSEASLAALLEEHARLAHELAQASDKASVAWGTCAEVSDQAMPAWRLEAAELRQGGLVAELELPRAELGALKQQLALAAQEVHAQPDKDSAAVRQQLCDLEQVHAQSDMESAAVRQQLCDLEQVHAQSDKNSAAVRHQLFDLEQELWLVQADLAHAHARLADSDAACTNLSQALQESQTRVAELDAELAGALERQVHDGVPVGAGRGAAIAGWIEEERRGADIAPASSDNEPTAAGTPHAASSAAAAATAACSVVDGTQTPSALKHSASQPSDLLLTKVVNLQCALSESKAYSSALEQELAGVQELMCAWLELAEGCCSQELQNCQQAARSREPGFEATAGGAGGDGAECSRSSRVSMPNGHSIASLLSTLQGASMLHASSNKDQCLSGIRMKQAHVEHILLNALGVSSPHHPSRSSPTAGASGLLINSGSQAADMVHTPPRNASYPHELGQVRGTAGSSAYLESTCTSPPAQDDGDFSTLSGGNLQYHVGRDPTYQQHYTDGAPSNMQHYTGWDPSNQEHYVSGTPSNQQHYAGVDPSRTTLSFADPAALYDHHAFPGSACYNNQGFTDPAALYHNQMYEFHMRGAELDDGGTGEDREPSTSSPEGWGGVRSSVDSDHSTVAPGTVTRRLRDDCDDPLQGLGGMWELPAAEPPPTFD